MSSSNLTFNPLRDPTTISSLQTLATILQTSIGPRGRLKLLQNTGTLSSSSQRLVYHISIKNVISKLIASAAKTQLKLFNNGGLFCGVLSSKLVLPSATDTSLSLPLVGTLYDIFVADFLSILKENCSIEVDFSNLEHLKSVVSTVLSSKPGCLLSRFDRNHLCSIILKAFLDNIPTTSKSAALTDCFRFVTIEGLPPIQSKCLKGALVQMPETNEKAFLDALHHKGPIKTALFTCSLAGDADWPVEKLETTSLDLVVDSTIRLLDDLVAKLFSDKVDLVFCQKVVHPRMKKRLQKAGILFIDRLGTETAKCIQYISGGNIIASLPCDLSYGTVSCISIEQLGTKSYLLLANEDLPMFTFVLAHFNEESSAELKVVCRQALDSLLRILKSPKVCFGGGCSEICAGLLLARKVKANIDTIKKEACCTSGQVLESLSLFLKAVASTSVAIHQGKILDFETESIHGHLWKLQDGLFPTAGQTCQCRSYNVEMIDSKSWLLLADICNSYSALSLLSGNVSEKDVLVTMSHINKSSEISLNDCSSLPVTDMKEQTLIKIGVPVAKSSVNWSFKAGTDSFTEVFKAFVASNNLTSDFNFPSSSKLDFKNDFLSPSNSKPNETEEDSLSFTSFNSTIPSPSINHFTSPILSKMMHNDSEKLPQYSRKSNIPSSVPFRDTKSVPSRSSKEDFHITQDLPPSPISIGNGSLLLDELSCKISSLSLAFETASLLLKTTVCINNLPP